jgi:MFS superfamily sulfate permease-like transporter
MSIFQLGFVSLFLSSALVSGYTTGAAVHVATSQVHHLLDIPKVNNSVPPGVLNVPKTWISIAQNVTQGNVNVATIIVSLISIIFLVIIRNVNLCWAKTKVYKKIPIPIPAQLILIIFATVISYFVGLNTRWNVSIVNKIAGGPPPFSVPVVEHISSLIQDAITIAVVTFAISVSLSQVFAKRNKYEISSNQELFAYGITSVCNSFFSGYSPSGSLSRSVVQETTGGKTQLVGLISSSILLAVIYVVAPLFEPLPKAILSSIVIVALYGMFKQLLHLYKYWKLSKVDFLVWIVVFLATFLLGVDLGLLVGVIFSLAMVIIRILLPIVTVLGIESSKDNEDNEVEVFALPGILILRYYAPICYLNAGVFQTTLRQKAQFDPPKADIGVGCWKAAYLKIKHLNTPSNNNQKSSNSLEFVSEPQTPTSITGSVSLAANQQINMCLIESINGQDLSITANHISVGIGSTGSNEMVHTIIIDCSAISFVDSVGTEVLEQV